MVIFNTEYKHPIGYTNYEEYNFPNGTYPGWTVVKGSFAQGGLGSGWITAGQTSTSCDMKISINYSKFKIQHRCYASRTTWGGLMSCGVYTSDTNNTAVFYGLTTASGYNVGSSIMIQGTTIYSGLTLSDGYYIDEIIFDNGNYTVNLYQDNNGEPGNLLYTGTGTGTAQSELYLHHDHGTTPYSQTNRVKVWYS